MIARMSKYDFILYAGQSDDFIERLRELGLVDVTCRGWEPSEGDRQLVTAIEGRTKALAALERFRSSEHFDAAARPFASGDEAYERYGRTAQERAALRTEIGQTEKAAEEARPWGDFSAGTLQRLARRGVVLRFFTAQRDAFEKSRDAWNEQAPVEVIHETSSTVWFVAVSHEGAELSFDAQEVKAPAMTAHDAEAKVASLRSRLSATDAEMSRAAASAALIERDCNRLREELQRVKVTATAEAAADGTLLVMEGWAERETSDRVDALLDEYPNVLYIKSDPTPEDETPVKLKNNRFARIFEMVGDMYARPKYGTIDLTPFFAPFYMLFFGICLNDAGYGLILLAMGMAMLWKFKGGMMRRAAWFATMCAVSTIVFGLFCGSFFGVSLKAYFPSIPFFDFQGRFFSWALAIGLVQILFGQVLRIVMVSATAGFRYALSTLGWFLVILAGSLAAGLPLLDPAWVIPGFTTSSPAFYGVAAIGVVLMLFFNSPGKNPFVNFGTGLWDTYNNITGILSDVLSYIRLFAIGLSGGILATVFNDLATGLSPDIPVVRELMILLILLVGHGINLFMSSISSFVHPMRLTFVEFYKNAGFEMAARQFEPLTKIDQSENKEQLKNSNFSVMTTAIIMAYVGVALMVGLSGMASCIGTSIAGMASVGAMKKNAGAFGSYMILAAIPGSQGLYGFVNYFIIKDFLTDEISMLQGAAIFGAGLLTGVVCLASSYFQSKVCANGITAIGNGHDVMGKTLILAAFPELYAILTVAAVFLIGGAI
uniref:V-type ATPase 116kDa subunit family protein n=1 Tax=Alistipes communis TaxID=2585118 RepID=UPI003FD7E347